MKNEVRSVLLTFVIVMAGVATVNYLERRFLSTKVEIPQTT